MDASTAKRYATALLELGLADGQYVKYGEELKDFAGSLAGAGKEADLLSSPSLPANVRKKMADGILEKAGLSPLVNNLSRLLFERGLLSRLPAVAEAYGKLLDEKEGVLRGTLYSPTELVQSEFAAVREALSIYTGKKVELAQSLKPELIGGVVAKLGDLVIDGSVKSRLEKLAAAFEGD
ncbi:MAG: ATP synthase F1 subunit delta [Deltaproteobacteria bacterium]|jgi:F-type H+-transporting ATPase subunit delta|nr:ATP synthase F1 subunit delta [Deltaproteobacteria bacterium]